MPSLPQLLKKASPLLKLTPIALVSVAFDVISDFFTAKPLADGTIPPHLRKPQKDKPEPVPIKCPDVNINIIKPAPTVIYDIDVNINVRNTKPFPVLPPRIAPSPPSQNSTNTEKEFTSSVGTPFSKMKFGCLLARPFYDDELVWCDYTEETPDELFGRIFDEITAFIDEWIADTITDKINTSCKLAVGLLPLPTVVKPLLIMGCDHLSEISNNYFQRNKILDNFISTGQVHVGTLTIQKCLITPVNLDYEDFALEDKNADCSIPLSAYDDNDGLKYDQLHVIWRDYDYDTTKKERLTVFPLPLDYNTITTEILKSTLPSTHRFGSTIYNIVFKLPESATAIPNSTVQFRQKAEHKIYGAESGDDQYKSFIDETYKATWIAGLCKPELELAKWYVTEVDNGTNEEIYEGDFYPYRAIYLGWEQETGRFTKWIMKAQWYIYLTPPSSP